MNDDLKQGIIVQGSREHLKKLKDELELRRQEIKKALEDPSLSDEKKNQIRQDLSKLEDEFKKKSKNTNYSLF